MKKIGLVIEREYTTRVRKKSFLILTLLMPLLLIALVAAPLALSLVKSSKTKVIAVSDPDSLYLNRMQSSEQYKLIQAGTNLKKIRTQVTEGDKIYAYLDIKGDLSTDSGRVTLFAAKQAEMELKNFLYNQLRELSRTDKIASYKIENLDKIMQQVEPVFSIQTVKWDKNGSEKKSSSEIAMIIGLAATMIIYIFIFAYGAMVMNGVIEEKSNRIVEIIVSSVKPFDLMIGKIIGIALVGLTQVMIWVILIGGIIGFASVAFKDSISADQMHQFSQELTKSQSVAPNGVNMIQMQGLNQNNSSDLDPAKINEIVSSLQSLNLLEIMVWFILFFLGGYLLYASLFAAIGSAIDNQEDANQFMLPVTMTVLFGLYAGIYSAQNPDGPLAFWCSMIPFTSPIVMMVRIPFGVPFWQLLLSFSLLTLAFLGVVKITAKIYRTGILMYGKKVTYKELWKWIRFKV
jgi:ABC-2 type transport system permease protein